MEDLRTRLLRAAMIWERLANIDAIHPAAQEAHRGDADRLRAELSKPEPAREELRAKTAGTLLGLMVAFTGGKEITSPEDGLKAWNDQYPDTQQLFLAAADRILALLTAAPSPSALRDAWRDGAEWGMQEGGVHFIPVLRLDDEAMRRYPDGRTP